MGQKFSNLLKPLKIGSVEIKNRFCVGPMALPSIFDDSGVFTEQGIRYYEERAKGGFGLIFSGATITDTEIDQIGMLGKTPLQNPLGFRRTSLELNERLRAYGTKMFPQVTMGLGRNAEGMCAPSDIPMFADPSRMAKGLTNEEVKRKIELVVHGAALMQASGFAGVEVHAMHWGYLLDQFAISMMNKRTDEYGGSLENRLRAAKEILEGIKQVCGSNFPVTMRLSLKTYVKGFNQASLFGEDEAGRTLEEGVRIAKLLEEYGYDALSTDAGVYDSFYHAAPPMYMKKGHLLDLYEAAKKEVSIPILAGSRMNDVYMSEQAILDGKIDAIVLSRPSLADPYLPNKVAMGKPEKIRPCIACNQACINALLLGKDCSCAVNPSAARESIMELNKALCTKKIAVVGAGIAGMEFARTASLRGHNVTVYEKTGSPGGNLIPGGTHDFKLEMKELNEWYQNELKDLNVNIKCNTTLDTDKIKGLGVDVVAFAMGAVPIMPKLAGIDKNHVYSSIDVLTGSKQVGKEVIVVGGGLVGCEIAYEYAKEGKKITIVEMLDSVLSAGEPVPLMNKMMLLDLLTHYKVTILTGNKLDSIEDSSVNIISTKTNEKTNISADTVVIAIGYKPVASIATELNETGIEVYEIGDGNKVGNVETSIKDAFITARLV